MTTATTKKSTSNDFAQILERVMYRPIEILPHPQLGKLKYRQVGAYAIACIQEALKISLTPFIKKPKEVLSPDEIAERINKYMVPMYESLTYTSIKQGIIKEKLPPEITDKKIAEIEEQADIVLSRLLSVPQSIELIMKAITLCFPEIDHPEYLQDWGLAALTMLLILKAFEKQQLAEQAAKV